MELNQRMKPVMSNAPKSVPTGVKILSVLDYIGAAFLTIFAIMLFFGASAIAQLIPGIGILGSGVFIIFGIICLGFAVLNFFIARGLWKGQNWARVISIVFLALGILSGLASLFQGEFSSIFSILIEGGIAAYLLFNQKVKKAFA